jgi:hypothetical protein
LPYPTEGLLAGHDEVCRRRGYPYPGAHTLPSGGLSLHEIKHDGVGIIARKDGERVRLYSPPGNDFTRSFPLIVEALERLCSRPAGRMPAHATRDRNLIWVDFQLKTLNGLPLECRLIGPMP